MRVEKVRVGVGVGMGMWMGVGVVVGVGVRVGVVMRSPGKSTAGAAGQRRAQLRLSGRGILPTTGDEVPMLQLLPA